VAEEWNAEGFLLLGDRDEGPELQPLLLQLT